jgi:hypothetical protein
LILVSINAMKTPKKTAKKTTGKTTKPAVSKDLGTPADEAKVKGSFNDDEDGFDEVPLDELDTFESYNEFDDEDDY